MSEFTIGVDPEFFLVDKDNNPVSAHDVLKGTKAEPFKCPSGAYQVDGIAAEFNTEPVPLHDFTAFNANIVRVIKEMSKAVKSVRGDVGFKVAPVLEFSQEFADSLPDSAKELGCDPDYSAYTLQPNPRPEGDRLFRTGAGHIHFGWGANIPTDNDEHIAICASFVKMLDATVGLLMTYIDRDPRRRELYGKAGAFRPKSYGVEYRTPSNVWLGNKVYREAVHCMMRTAVQLMKNGYTPENMYGLTQDAIQSIIDTGDFERAKQCVRKYCTNFGSVVVEVTKAIESEKAAA